MNNIEKPDKPTSFDVGESNMLNIFENLDSGGLNQRLSRIAVTLFLQSKKTSDNPSVDISIEGGESIGFTITATGKGLTRDEVENTCTVVGKSGKIEEYNNIIISLMNVSGGSFILNSNPDDEDGFIGQFTPTQFQYLNDEWDSDDDVGLKVSFNTNHSPSDIELWARKFEEVHNDKDEITIELDI